MSKKLLAVLTALTLMAGMAACGTGNNNSSASGSDAGASESDAGGSREGNTLIMATEAGFAPYEYLENGEIVGIDVEIANEIANAMGKTLVIEDMPFDSIIASVNSGKADFGAAGMSVTEERLQEVDFTVEYAVSDQVIVTKEGSGITGSDGLTDKSVGVQLGTTADFALADGLIPGAAVEQYNRYSDAVLDLINGRIEAIVMDNIPAEIMLASNEGLEIVDGVLFTDTYAICVKKGNTELLNQMNTVLERLMAEGKIEEYTIKHSK